MTDPVPTRKMSRAAIVAATAVKIGTNELGNAARNLISPAKQGRDSVDAMNAKAVFSTLSRLRGTALKIGQILGMESGLLPQAYQKELQKSFSQVPPLSRVIVSKALQQAYGTAPLPFVDFDECAFAAASLGQVHRARLPGGTPVAVKIQYPGMDATIKNDIELARSLFSALPNYKAVLNVLDEAQQRLEEELDYINEAHNAQYFEENLKLDGVKIVSSMPALSRSSVLVSEFVEGQHLHEWLQSDPAQHKRDRVGQNLYDFFMASLRQVGQLHADPNPGNFLFQKDGSIAVIDFGCCQPVSPEFVDNIARIQLSYLEGDASEVFCAYRDLGIRFEEENEDFFQQVLKPFGDWLVLPLRNERFNFRNNPDYFQTGIDVGQTLAAELRKLAHLPDSFPFFTRTHHGILQILADLKAEVRMCHWWV